MTTALDAFVDGAEQVVGRLAASGEPSNPLPPEWGAYRRTAPSKAYPRDGREFPQFLARALSTVSPG